MNNIAQNNNKSKSNSETLNMSKRTSEIASQLRTIQAEEMLARFRSKEDIYKYLT
jgi:hypothetical protein